MNQDNFTKLLQGYGDRLGDRKMFNGLVKDFFMDKPLQANLILLRPKKNRNQNEWL